MIKRHTYSANIGMTSLLLIFIVLSLVSFSVLSLSSALADRNLTDKIAGKTAAYYEASNAAQERIAGIDEALHLMYLGNTKDEYLENAGDSSSFSIAVSDNQALEVKLKILYPENKDGAFYSVERYCLVTTKAPVAEDEPMNLLIK